MNHEIIEQFNALLIKMALSFSRSHSNNFRTIKLDELIGNCYNRHEIFIELKRKINELPFCEVQWKEAKCKIKINNPNAILKQMGYVTKDEHKKSIQQQLLFCNTPTALEFVNNLTDKYLCNDKLHEDVKLTAMFIQHVTKDDYIPLDRRTVSSQIYHQTNGSKVIEKKQGIISRIIQDVLGWDDDMVKSIMDFDLFENPIYIYGNINLDIKNLIVNGIVTPFLIIFPEYFEKITTTCKRIITIENKTTFNRWIRKQNKENNIDDIVIYTQGFPNKHVINIIKLIAKQNNIYEILHFGDMDRGGFKIRKYIENQVRLPIKTYGWTENDILKYGYHLDYHNVEALTPIEQFAKSHNIGVEQENIPIIF